MQSAEFNPEERGTLLALARQTIVHGISSGDLVSPRVQEYPEHLRQKRASFVTIMRSDEMRGCIGSTSPQLPLVVDVAHNAYSAAFREPRFPPLEDWELFDLDITISIVSALELLDFANETELLAKMRPGIDGIVLEDGQFRGSFLPTMWDELPNPQEFLSHLKRRAGLPPRYWSESLRASRYTTERFSEKEMGKRGDDFTDDSGAHSS